MTGPELRAMRLRLRLSQEELAQVLGVHRNTITRWETGRWPVGRMETLALRAIGAGLHARAPRRRRRKR